MNKLYTKLTALALLLTGINNCMFSSEDNRKDDWFSSNDAQELSPENRTLTTESSRFIIPSAALGAFTGQYFDQKAARNPSYLTAIGTAIGVMASAYAVQKLYDRASNDFLIRRVNALADQQYPSGMDNIELVALYTELKNRYTCLYTPWNWGKNMKEAYDKASNLYNQLMKKPTL